MDILKELKETDEKFKEIQKEIEVKRNEIVQLDGILNQLQGEYKILVKFGKEQNLVDDLGKPIQVVNKEGNLEVEKQE